MIRDDVLETVTRCIADALALDPAEIAVESRLIDDLGADSLDFVDIIFQLDQALDIRVRESEFNFLTRLDFSSPEVMKEGHLTPEVVAKLETWLPGLRKLPDKSRVTPQELFGLIDVEAICIVASRRLDEREQSAV